MNVKELKERLSHIDDDVLVFVSSDSEGNRIKYLSDAEIEPYIEQDNRREVDVIASDDVGSEYDEEDVFYGLVLWPI